MMIVMNTAKPRPRYSGEPHGKACGALMLGHKANKPAWAPDAAGFEHGPLPPIQSLKPASTRWMPMSITVGPVTMGGKTLRRTLGGRKEMRISVMAQMAEVRAWEEISTGIRRTEAAGVHLTKSPLTDGNDAEGDADNRKNTGADEVSIGGEKASVNRKGPRTNQLQREAFYVTRAFDNNTFPTW